MKERTNRIKWSSVRIRPWPLRWVPGQASLLPLSQGEAFTLASISYLAILVKCILAKKKKKIGRIKFLSRKNKRNRDTRLNFDRLWVVNRPEHNREKTSCFATALSAWAKRKVINPLAGFGREKALSKSLAISHGNMHRTYSVTTGKELFPTKLHTVCFRGLHVVFMKGQEPVSSLSSRFLG